MVSSLDIFNDSFYLNSYSFSWNTQCWIFLFHFIYIIPSIFVLIRILRLIFDFQRFRLNDGFQSVFFKMFLQDILLNIALFLVDLLSNRLPQTGILTYYLARTDPSYWLTILYFLFQYLQIACFFSSFSLTFIRLVAVSFPFQVDQLLPVLRWILTFFIFLAPISTTWFLIPVYCFFRHVLDYPGSVNIDYKRVFPKWKSSECLVVVSVSLSILGLLSGLGTLLRMKATTKKRSFLSKKSAELALTLTTASSFVCLGINAILLLIFLDGGNVVGLHVQAVFVIRPFLLDILHFLPLWIFYFSHPSLRKKKSSTVAILSPGESNRSSFPSR